MIKYKMLWYVILLLGFAQAGSAAVIRTTPAPQEHIYTQMLRAANYSGLEAEFAQHLAADKRDTKGKSELLGAYNFMVSKASMESLQSWAKASPRSQVPRTLLGMKRIRAAMAARNKGEAAAQDQFRGLLQEASSDFSAAYKLEPRDPVAAAWMVLLSSTLDQSPAAVDRWFQRALKADPWNGLAVDNKYSSLLPKKGGSFEPLIAFSRESAANAPKKNSRSRLKIALAHYAYYQTLSPQEQDGYFRQPKVWKEIQAVFDFHLKTYPEDLDARNWLAWYAVEAGQNEAATRAFAIIGDRWTRSPWETKERYERARSAVGVN